METHILNADLKVLSAKEVLDINAGESLWYWIAYGIGSVGRFVSALWKYCGEHPEEFIA